MYQKPLRSGDSDSHVESSSIGACVPSARTRTGWFVLLNAMVISALAVCHPFSQSPDLIAGHGLRSYFGVVVLETVLLFLPAFICLVFPLRFESRAGNRIAKVFAIGISIAYSCDLILYLTIHEHLWSRVTLGLATSLLPTVWWYVSFREVGLFVAVVGGWVCLQWVCWWFAGVLGRVVAQKIEMNGRELALGIACLVAVPIVFALPALRNASETLGEIRKYADRHPLASTGWFPANATPQYEPSSDESVRGAALMLAKSHEFLEIKNRYQRISVVAAAEPVPPQRPDVLLVISECLRPELIQAKTMPSVFSRSQNGLTLNQHFSAGNSSNLGFFGLMTGLDSCWFSHASELPIGMFELLQQSGYEVGFFGRDGFDQFAMDTFCGPERFDVTEYVPAEDDVVSGDLEVSRLAQQFLDRTGKFASTESNPRFAFVYMYAPHYSYYCEDVDRIHDASDLDRFQPAARERSESILIRYLNSAHFVDRAIAPLLRDDRLTFVLGDHGESFGEDGRLMHGTAMSRSQLQVGCVSFGPGIPAKQVDLITSHVDVMPTMLDALGIPFESGIPMPGVSMIRPIPSEQVVSAKSFQRGTVFFRRDQFMQNRATVPFGYQGFFEIRSRVLSPGGDIDANGNLTDGEESTDRRWANAHLMRRWLRQQFGDAFSEIPANPMASIRVALQSDSENDRIAAIRLISALGPSRKDMLGDLEKMMMDPVSEVRSAAFEVIHQAHR